MGLLSNGNITLVDLTDNRSATLYLSTSLSKIQVESEGIYQPDYSQGDGQVITPSLYFGQTEVEFNKIIYKIDGVEVESTGNKLYITNNLEKTILVTAIIPEATDVNGVVYNNIEGQIELVKMSNPKENFLPIIEYTRDAFNDKEEEDIILTAVLYKGGQKYNDGLSYKWTNTSSFNVDNTPKILGDKEELTVERSGVDNITTFICEITVEEQNKSYTARVTLRDWTDPLSSQIISSQGLYIPKIEGNLQLTCKIFKGINEINSEGEGDSSDFTYDWFYSLEKSTNNVPNSLGETGKTITISPKEISNLTSPQYVTFYCQAIQTSTGEETSSQITIVISPEIKIILEPKEIFLSCDENGSLKEENFEQIVNFKITDSSGSLLPLEEGEGVIIPSIDNITITSSETPQEGWSQSFKIGINKENSNKLSNSSLIKIPYVYFGVKESEELYLIKNIQGETGVSVTVDEVEYLDSGTQINPSSVTVGWSKDYPTLTKGKYLYTRTTFSNGSKIYTESYQGTDGGPGAAAVYNYLLTPASVITKEGSNYSQDSITFSAFSSVGTETGAKSVFWEIFIDDSLTPLDFISKIGETQTLYLNGDEENKISPINNIKVKIYEIKNKKDQGDFIDEETIEILNSEKNLAVSLTNDNIIISYKHNGTEFVPDFSNANTSFSIYYGLENITDKCNIEIYFNDKNETKVPENNINNNSIIINEEPQYNAIIIKATYLDKQILKSCNILKIYGGDSDIKSLEDYYTSSFNGINPPITGWQTSKELSPQSFIWKKQLITYKNNREPDIKYFVIEYTGLENDNILYPNIQTVVPLYKLFSRESSESSIAPGSISDPINNWSEKIPVREENKEMDLWIAYKIQYLNTNNENVTGYSYGFPASMIPNLDTSLQSENFRFAVTAYDFEGGYTIARQTALEINEGKIKGTIEDGKEEQTYLLFDTTGLTIGSTESDYYSQILNENIENSTKAGFYIKHKREERALDDEIILEDKTAGIFNSVGLRTNSISLNMESEGIIMLKTSLGGISFGETGGV